MAIHYNTGDTDHYRKINIIAFVRQLLFSPAIFYIFWKLQNTFTRQLSCEHVHNKWSSTSVLYDRPYNKSALYPGMQ